MSDADFLFHHEDTHVQIVAGSVGWDDDDNYVDFGTADNDGHTFIKVQLYAGRDFTKPLTPDRAQGHKIFCSMNSLNGKRVPPKNTRVLIALPHGMEHVRGAGMIIGSYEQSAPADQLNKDRVVLDYGPNVHVVIKGKSVAVQSYDNEFVSVGTPRSGGTSGVTIQGKDGTGMVVQEGALGLFVAQDGDAKTVMQFTPTKVQCFVKSGGYMSVDADGFFCSGNSTWISGGNVYLGQHPSLATSAAYRPSGPGTVVVGGSASVFISP